MKISRFTSAVRYMSKLKKSSGTKATPQSEGPVFQDKNGNIVLQVQAKPGAKANKITGIEDEGVGVQINARPVDGEANSELVKYVTGLLGLKKNEISLEKGLKSRQKVLLISRKDFTVEYVIEKLKTEMNS